jgi:rRNA-processing protein FCF1
MQARESRRQTALQDVMRRDSAQPYVWVDFRTDDRNGVVFELVLKNEGPSVATDVVVTFDPPLASRLSDVLGEVIKVASMPPGRSLRWFFDSGMTLYDDDSVVKRYRVAITSTGPFGAVPPLAYDLDLNDFLKSAIAPPGTLHGVTQELEKIKNELRKTARRKS